MMENYERKDGDEIVKISSPVPMQVRALTTETKIVEVDVKPAFEDIKKYAICAKQVLKEVFPDKINIEMDFYVEVESSKAFATLIGSGNTAATIKVSMEWDNTKS